MSERQYAARIGLSHGAIQKAKATGRLVLHGDGSIDAATSDRLRGQTTDPSKTRDVPAPKLKPVTWPAGVAALMAAELGVEPATMQNILDAHVRAHLEELARPRIDI